MDRLIKSKRGKFWVNAISIFSLLLCLAFFIYAFKAGLLTQEEKLSNFLLKFGIFAPLAIILIQALQVIFPAVPLSIGLLVSILLFGKFEGFIYNYLGICLGSIAAFAISKKYGTSVLELLFSKKTLKSYKNLGKRKDFIYLFAFLIFFPLAPDDFLCYFAGTTSMSFSKFCLIIFLAKPFPIAIYSFGLKFALDYVIKFFS